MSHADNHSDAPRLEDYLVRSTATPNDLLGTLKAKRLPGATRVTVVSNKWANCVLSWKKFVFDILPISVGAITIIPSSAVAAAIVALQAVKTAADTMDIEFPPEASAIILRVAQLQRAAEECERSPWISIDDILNDSFEFPLEQSRLDVLLRDLDRLGVLRFDLDEQYVRIVEELAFDPANEAQR